MGIKFSNLYNGKICVINWYEKLLLPFLQYSFCTMATNWTIRCERSTPYWIQHREDWTQFCLSIPILLGPTTRNYRTVISTQRYILVWTGNYRPWRAHKVYWDCSRIQPFSYGRLRLHTRPCSRDRSSLMSKFMRLWVFEACYLHLNIQYSYYLKISGSRFENFRGRSLYLHIIVGEYYQGSGFKSW